MQQKRGQPVYAMGAKIEPDVSLAASACCPQEDIILGINTPSVALVKSRLSSTTMRLSLPLMFAFTNPSRSWRIRRQSEASPDWSMTISPGSRNVPAKGLSDQGSTTTELGTIGPLDQAV